MKRILYMANIFFYVFVQPNLALERLLLLVFCSRSFTTVRLCKRSGIFVDNRSLFVAFYRNFLVKCINWKKGQGVVTILRYACTMQSLNTIPKTNKRFQTRSNSELLFVTTDLSSVTGSAMKRLLAVTTKMAVSSNKTVLRYCK